MQIINDVAIKNRIKRLPENIRKAIESFDWVHESMKFTRKYHIQIDDIEIFRIQTLAVVTGLQPAENYKRLLFQNMNITEDIAEKLVEDANEYIFSKLQKRAFNKDGEDDLDIAEDLKEEGIELIEEEINEKPKTRLQKLTDSLLDEDKENIVETKEFEKQEIKDTKQTPVQYNEPVEISDLAGITQHRTPYVHHEGTPTPETNISKSMYEKRFIPKESSIDLSPSKEQQVVENGDFLNHIGSNSENNS